MSKLSVEEYRRLLAERRKAPKANKYHAKRTASGHASKKESRRAGELRLLEKKGLIADLREQVRFELIPAQYGECGKDFKGRDVKVCLERSCSYVADFVYRDSSGRVVVEDCKGVRTEVYKIKKKLMLFRHGIVIKES